MKDNGLQTAIGRADSGIFDRAIRLLPLCGGYSNE